MKIAYLHNLPLEYYPPATNFLNLLGRSQKARVRVYTTHNARKRKAYKNDSISIIRSHPQNPSANSLSRLVVALWWHIKTACSLFLFRADAIVYVEPHSAISAYLYYRVFRGSARLFIHHHEYYAPIDYDRPGMRLPRLGSRLEYNWLFSQAVWISHTNEDRLRLAKKDNPEVADAAWQTLPNYPPVDWAASLHNKPQKLEGAPVRLIYVGAASFEDTYIMEIVRWVASHPRQLELHVCGYNVAEDVWIWLEKEQFANVTFEGKGYEYEELPDILGQFDIGLVLYKGNTTNFVYNVPNKVFEYLVCGLEVWYPKEMLGIKKFCLQSSGRLREMNFSGMNDLHPDGLRPFEQTFPRRSEFTADQAFSPLCRQLGLVDWATCK